MSYEARYAAYHQAVEDALAAAIDACGAPEPLMGAMRYSLLSGGKRLRPVMLLAAAEAAHGATEVALPFACALEMIHTYSLIHDDLPAMDDDDLRRGRPTNHRVYGEGMAILAGDGLLSLAFSLMLEAADTPDKVRAARRIAEAAGVRGMVGGQCVDIQSERQGTQAPEEALAYIHRHKTADLFIGAVTAGLILGGATDAQVQAGAAYAEAVGTAFQVQDDLLDIEGDAALLGKATGMDAARGKLTWPGVFGAEAAHDAVKARTEAALAALAPIGEGGAFLREMALALLARNR